MRDFNEALDNPGAFVTNDPPGDPDVPNVQMVTGGDYDASTQVDDAAPPPTPFDTMVSSSMLNTTDRDVVNAAQQLSIESGPPVGPSTVPPLDDMTQVLQGALDASTPLETPTPEFQLVVLKTGQAEAIVVSSGVVTISQSELNYQVAQTEVSREQVGSVSIPQQIAEPSTPFVMDAPESIQEQRVEPSGPMSPVLSANPTDVGTALTLTQDTGPLDWTRYLRQAETNLAATMSVQTFEMAEAVEPTVVPEETSPLVTATVPTFVPEPLDVDWPESELPSSVTVPEGESVESSALDLPDIASTVPRDETPDGLETINLRLSELSDQVSQLMSARTPEEPLTATTAPFNPSQAEWKTSFGESPTQEYIDPRGRIRIPAASPSTDQLSFGGANFAGGWGNSRFVADGSMIDNKGPFGSNELMDSFVPNIGKRE